MVVCVGPPPFWRSFVRRVLSRLLLLLQVLRRIPANGGIVMVNFYSDYVACSPVATLADVANHVRAGATCELARCW